MTIETRFLGPTNYRPSRVKVSVSRPGNEKITRTYSVSHAEHCIHDYATLRFIADFEKLARESFKMYEYDPGLVDVLSRKPTGPWYKAETERGYLYTNTPAWTLNESEGE